MGDIRVNGKTTPSRTSSEGRKEYSFHIEFHCISSQNRPFANSIIELQCWIWILRPLYHDVATFVDGVHGQAHESHIDVIEWMKAEQCAIWQWHFDCCIVCDSPTSLCLSEATHCLLWQLSFLYIKSTPFFLLLLFSINYFIEKHNFKVKNERSVRKSVHEVNQVQCEGISTPDRHRQQHIPMDRRMCATASHNHASHIHASESISAEEVS